MAKNLVIVESPAKAKTIEKFLGKDYTVLSSYGHIRDLHKKDFSIDIENGFKPIYEIPDDKKEIVATLKKKVKEADTIWLASDEDREGEAISWHLYETLKLTPQNSKRIVFHEITKSAILNAIENPREIDLNLVDAQQARRVLDRIVGFELSPVLWRKIKRGLSAGRVQSVAVRLIVDREKEIEAFKSETYYRVTAEFQTADSKTPIRAELASRLKDEQEVTAFLEACKSAEFSVKDISVKDVKRTPAAPFTTSTLQQEANRKLGYSVSQTMRIAQSLYEAGYITYMRTDSLNLSSLAIGTISEEIKSSMGDKYLKVRKYHTTSKGAQEAHEAIRPTYIANKTINGSNMERKLYDLIYKRTIASQMSDAVIEKTAIAITLNNRPEHFVAQGEVIKFDGFLKVYIESNVDDEESSPVLEGMLPKLNVGESLAYKTIDATMRFTQQPARYNEASLVRKMEELGIGRPSTYAPTIGTILAREYVETGTKTGTKREYRQYTLSVGEISQQTRTENVGAEKGKLLPTDTGRIVNDFLEEYFPQIIDYNFTANVEGEFDKIASGKQEWHSEIANFYHLFHPNVESVSNMKMEHKVGERLLGIDPKTGKPVSVKIGRFGPIVQIGSTDQEDKPQFASLLKGQTISSITLEEALKLFSLPRTLGQYEGEEVSANTGRFGPYVKYGKSFVSIPATLSPFSISLEEALQLIKAKREADNNRIINTFSDMQVLNGRFGPYIAFEGKNYKIAKGTDAKSLTEEDCHNLIEEQKQAQREADSNRTINTFGDIQVLNGRYGPYIAFEGKNYKIAKGTDAKALTEEDCLRLIEEQKNALQKKTIRRASTKSKKS